MESYDARTHPRTRNPPPQIRRPQLQPHADVEQLVLLNPHAHQDQEDGHGHFDHAQELLGHLHRLPEYDTRRLEPHVDVDQLVRLETRGHQGGRGDFAAEEFLALLCVVEAFVAISFALVSAGFDAYKSIDVDVGFESSGVVFWELVYVTEEFLCVVEMSVAIFLALV